MKSLILLFVFVFATNFFAQVPTYVPKNGLLGWWGFNGNANDESGNGNHGIVNGPTLVSDRFSNDNSAYIFNGNGDHILVPHSPSFINPNMSFSGWVNASQFQTYFNSIIKHGNFTSIAGEQYGVGLTQTGQVHTGFKTTSCTTGQGWDISITIDTLHLNTWYHLVVTIENNIVKTYLNSTIISTYPYIGSLVLCTANSELSFGREFSSSDNHYYGKLDDIGIWNRALSQSEITELYQTKATGIQDEKYYTFLIYPNPASTFITVDCGDNSELSSYSFTITNSLGQEKLAYKFTTRFQQIDISKIGGAGLYIISIRDNNNTVIETRKLLIQ